MDFAMQSTESSGLRFGVNIMIVYEYLAFFFFILVFGYLLPAGQFYFKYHVRQQPDLRPIQTRRPNRKGIRREIRMSLVSIAIFAALSTMLLELWRMGKTSIYRDVREYPLIYMPVSFVLCVALFDTYFYWVHRFMHWQPVFKYAHAGHHRSVSPTPWAIYAFQPAEAILQFGSIALLVLFLPLHPVVLLVFLSYDTFVNTAGHVGYEIVPGTLSGRWPLDRFSTVTDHDTHHTNMQVNFGSFLNVWDRWMGTYSDKRPGARSDSSDVGKHMPPRSVNE
jgi:lathosterol oxidase